MLLEGLFTSSAHLHNRAHIDLVKRCEHCGCVLSFDQALGNGLSTP